MLLGSSSSINQQCLGSPHRVITAHSWVMANGGHPSFDYPRVLSGGEMVCPGYPSHSMTAFGLCLSSLRRVVVTSNANGC